MKNRKLSQLEWKNRFTYVKNVPFNQEDLHCEGTKFQVVKFKSGTSIKPHYHKKTFEIFYIRKGSGTLILNGEKFECQPDDFFLCEPNDVHEVVNNNDEDFIILIFKTNEVEEDIYWD